MDTSVFNDEREKYGETQEISQGPLNSLMKQLCCNHLLQMIFLKNFLTSERKINTNNSWVWVVHALNYPYIFYVFYFTDARQNCNSLAKKIWIPLDMLLTLGVTMYQFGYRYME